MVFKFHTIGSQWSSFVESMQNMFILSESEVSDAIFAVFSQVEEILEKSGIRYDNLKHALIPPDTREKFDIAFIFDAEPLSGICDYGTPIFKEAFNVLSSDEFKKSKNSVFFGDLLENRTGFNETFQDINKQLGINLSKSTTYCVLLISNLSFKQRIFIENSFKKSRNFIGSVDWSLRNDIMKYSLMLVPIALKSERNLIMPLSDGVNHFNTDLVQANFKITGIEDYLFDLFLRYNYHSVVYTGNKDYTLNILNGLHATDIKDYKLLVEDKKYTYLKNNKTHVINQVKEFLKMNDEDELAREGFVENLLKSISTYIFNIEKTDYITKFNTIVDTDNKRSFASFEYNAENQEIRLITMT